MANRAKETQKAKKKLDALFSKMVRERIGGCISCGAYCEGRNRHSGHFQRRGLMSTRWNPLNSNPQCYRCNINLSGNQYEYGLALDIKFGDGTAENLYKLGQKMRTFTLEDMQHLIKVLQDNPEDYEAEYALLTKDLIAKVQ